MRDVNVLGSSLTALDITPSDARNALYLIVHRASGKAYVGVTRRTVAERWREHRAAISARQIGKTGRTMSPEARAKISAARKGKALSAEHRAKLSAAKKGRSDITEHCRRIAPLGARKARTAASSQGNGNGAA